MLDHADYITQGDHHQGNGNGADPLSYDHLEGDWALFYKVAKGFKHKVKPDDRQDFLHDLMLTMAKVKAKNDLSGKPLTEAGLKRVASYQVADYWRKQYRLVNWIDCGSCSQKQRHNCKDNGRYSDCPKAIRLESLDRLIEDGNGGKTELYQMLADDKAPDIVAMLDAKHTIKGYPTRAIQIAYKRYSGYPLDSHEQRYLNRYRNKLQKTLI